MKRTERVDFEDLEFGQRFYINSSSDEKWIKYPIFTGPGNSAWFNAFKMETGEFRFFAPEEKVEAVKEG